MPSKQIPSECALVKLARDSATYNPLTDGHLAHEEEVSFESLKHNLFCLHNEPNKTILEKYWRYRSDRNKHVGYYKVNDCLVFDEWGLVVHENKNFANLTVGFGWNHEHLAFLEKKGRLVVRDNKITELKFPDLQVHDLDGLACLMSFPGALTYGHWIVDLWGRVEILKRAGIFFDVQYFIFPGPCTAWMERFFHLFGISQSRIVFVNKRTGYNISNLIVPTVPSQSPGGALPMQLCKPLYSRWSNLFRNWFDESTKNSRIPIFLKHTPMTSEKDRLLSNGEEVASLIGSYGGLTIDPTRMGIGQLISHICKASIVIGQDSSALHNVSFVGRDILVIETQPRGNLLHASLQEATDCRIGYISSELLDGNWSVDLGKLSLAIQKFS